MYVSPEPSPDDEARFSQLRQRDGQRQVLSNLTMCMLIEGGYCNFLPSSPSWKPTRKISVRDTPTPALARLPPSPPCPMSSQQIPVCTLTPPTSPRHTGHTHTHPLRSAIGCDHW